MRWTDDEKIKCISLITNGNTYDEIADALGRTAKAVKLQCNRLGHFYNDHNPKIIKICKQCDGEITNAGKVFCSSSCAATFNNLQRGKQTRECITCEQTTTNDLYCSRSCFWEHMRKKLLDNILAGDASADSCKKYLIKLHGNKCMDCGWSETNKQSGKIPVEMDHIDGNSDNNNLENLKLLCPNCHSLTPTYGALNLGNGRYIRRLRYSEGKSR